MVKFMHTQRLTAKTFKMHHQSTQASYTRGCISELSYQGQNPALLNMLLFPLLKQLGEQSRWQLWLTPAHKLSRHWLQQAGLPLEKSVQIASTERISSVSAMIKALRSGNFSVVIAWLPAGLSNSERHELEQAAIEGHTLGLIMREENTFDSPGGQENRLKIHSSLLH
ncbi:SOS-induced cell division inhibitor SulA [Tatumella ptyseos]|nr:SOS-induced cell division inhibitor SulA [Tatumella ptyseos]